MLEGMTSRHLAEWEAMFDRWNIGDSPAYRGDVQAGIIAATVANANRQRGRAAKPSDFLPTFEKQAEPGTQTPDALYAGMMRLARKAAKPRARRGATTTAKHDE